MNDELYEIAQKTKNQSNPTVPEVSATPTYDEDDDAVVIGTSFAPTSSPLNREDVDITEDDLKSSVDDFPSYIYEFDLTDDEKRQVVDFERQLIVNNIMGPDEARASAINRAKKIVEEKSSNDHNNAPDLTIVSINKENVDKLEFSEEEKDKLTKSKAIRLNIIEDEDLKMIKVKKVDKKHKLSMLRGIDMSLSQYSVPLPIMGDFCSFKGEKIVALAQAVMNEDATMVEVITKKARLIYNNLISGANISVRDAQGKVTMTFEDFLNVYPYHEIDMSLYGILVASSMEEVETNLTCGKCKKPFTFKYNIKSLLTDEGLSDFIKERYDTVLKNKSNPAKLMELANRNSWRIQSPLSNNIYELSYPTIAKAIAVFSKIDEEDEVQLYLSIVMLFISTLYVYDRKNGDYLPITDEDEELDEMIEAVSKLSQQDIDIIFKFLQDYIYSPTFMLKSKCSFCGNEMSNNLDIQRMVFLTAQGSSVEIVQ